MKKLIALLLCALTLMSCAFCAFAEESDTLAAPTDFTFDTETGSYSFNMTDANVGYYFIRVYPVANGVESDRYVASSRRINGKKTGEVTGSMDISGIGWGTYNVKLISFAPSGKNYEAPSPVILTANYGIGGKLERPELLVITDGNEAEVIIDWYTLSDYYTFQMLPVIQFTVYDDEALTNVVAEGSTDLSPLGSEASVHPAGGIMWKNYTMYGKHDYIMGNECNYTLTPDFTATLPAGTYYVTAQAISGTDAIAASEVSEAVAFTVTDEEPNGEFTAVHTTLWEDPKVMGVMNAAAGGTAEPRVDCGNTQTTSSEIA